MPEATQFPDVVTPTSERRSRRALLVGGIGGLAAVLAGAMASPFRARAAAGDPLILGSTSNNAGSSGTKISSHVNGNAFAVSQSGAGNVANGIRGDARDGTGGVFTSTNNNALFAVAAHADRVATFAHNPASEQGSGAAGKFVGGQNTGVIVESQRTAVHAIGETGVSAAGSMRGVIGTSGNGVGVAGESTSAEGLSGSSVSGIGVRGESLTGFGVRGEGADAGGVIGVSESGSGVVGQSTSDAGVAGSSQASVGVRGSSAESYGIWGDSRTNAGVRGTSESGAGVFGYSASSFGLYGNSDSGTGVWAFSASGLAGQFSGDVTVSGMLTKGGGALRIDHPLDPANRLLQHSFVESPDMKNIYDGVARADAMGRSTVTLPPWFEALNRDVRYQLTPIGAAMPELHIGVRLRDGRFDIAGASPHGDVSWQITGIRRDRWAEAHPLEVEVDKPAGQRGRYLHPLEHGRQASEALEPSPVDRPRE